MSFELRAVFTGDETMRKRMSYIGMALGLMTMSAAESQTLPPYYLSAPTMYIKHQMQKSMLSTRVFNSMVANDMIKRQMLKDAKGKKSTSKKTARKVSSSKKVAAKGTTAKPIAKGSPPIPSRGTTAVAGSTLFQPASQSLFLAQLANQPGDDKQKEQAKQIFTTLWNSYKQFSEEQGYSYNDVARAMSYFVGVSFKVKHGPSAATPQQVRAMHGQFKEHLSHNADFQKMSDRQRQELAEMLVMMGGMAGLAKDMADQTGNRDIERQAKELASQSVQGVLGVSLDSLKLTDSGLQQL
jgi:hypothetical protein